MIRKVYNPLLILLLSTPTIMAHDHGHAPGGDALQFHENKGQWPSQVRYQARTPGGALFVENAALTYVLTRGGEHLGHGDPDHVPEPLQMHAYKVHFEGGHASGHAGTHRFPHYVNYFLGDDPAKWAGGVPVYGGVELSEVYPGIGMRIDGSKGLKYDWLVAPGADPGQITMRYEGVDELRVEHGLVFIETSVGRVVEQRPVAWQEVHGQRRPVDCRYVKDGDRVRFELPYGHDPRYPLVIDPVVVFSSYSGSFADNFGFTATYDESGHLYGGGHVLGVGYPTTTGVLQPGFMGGAVDMGITKFSPDGTALVWSTYIGGSGNEVPHSMVVNSDDELFILGSTGSTNFPTTPGCFDNTYGGGNNPPFVGLYGFTYTTGSDAVVLHLSSDATQLIGSTYVGGAGNDGLNQNTPVNRNYGDPFRGEIIVDADGNPLVVTSTASNGLPTTPGAVQTTLQGQLDAYVFRMDPGLTQLLWATYYGGSGIDAGFGIQVSSTGEIYITGGTTSTNLPSAGTPVSPSYGGGQTDGFIARFHPSGSPLLSTTYVGGTGLDLSYFVQLDVNDDVYVVGQTTGPYPVTPGKYANPNATQFIHKFSGDLSTSLWSTRIGGSGGENISPSAFLVSHCGQIYFSGWAGTTNAAGAAGLSSSTIGLPVTADAFQSTTNGSDFYLMMLEPEAEALGYATFFGGVAAEHVDGGTSRFDKNGIVYQAVCAGCSNLSYPTTPGVVGPTNNSINCNLGVFKIDFEQATQVSVDVQGTFLDQVCPGQPVTVVAIGTATEFEWDMGDGNAGPDTVSFEYVYNTPGTYTITVIGTDPTANCITPDTATYTVTVIEPPTLHVAFTANITVDCHGVSGFFTNQSDPGMQYFWDFGDGSTATTANPFHPFPGHGTYDVTLYVHDPVCGGTDSLTQRFVLDPPTYVVDLPGTVTICEGVPETLSIDWVPGFIEWSTGETGTSIVVSTPGTYWVTAQDGGCMASDTVQVLLQDPPGVMTDVRTCRGEPVELRPAVDLVSVVWNTGDTAHVLQVDEGGVYYFTGVDQFGCVVRDTVEVGLLNVADYVYPPNVFTPNRDGHNDVFRVTDAHIPGFHMEIFNRWGQLVYESSSSTAGWNGKVSGSDAPDGTYYYTLDFDDPCAPDGRTEFKGHVTLLR
jgi:gliding motility-associated-like protein